MIKRFIDKILGKSAPAAAKSRFGKRVEIGPEVHGINPALVDERAINVVRTLKNAGFEAYVVGGAVRDHRLRQRGAEAGDVAEQGGGSGVQLDSDFVDHGLDDAIELFTEGRLIDVVLVLADADRSGVDLHQLSEWILKSPADGDGAANGDIE